MGSLGILPADHRQTAAVVHVGMADDDGVHAAQLLNQTEVEQPVPAAKADAAV
jgi:hypothetical protein